jgi:hypothetical protein
MKKINHKTIISIFIFLGVFVFCQSTDPTAKPVSGGDDILQIPNIIPPSPESSFRTDFGNLALNEYRGIPQISIPIYEITNGDLKHSISLSYSKLGVKVDDIPDITGVSWLLNVGGVISRTVYDLPDERNIRDLISDMASLNISSIQEGTSAGNWLSNKIKNKSIDHEVDIFNYAVDGYSGSFYLNNNLQPILLEEGTGVKIEVVGNFKDTHQFILTGPNGVKYYFGGDGFTEETYIRDNAMLNAISGFYLSKIESGNNIINLSYDTDLPKQISMKIDETKSISTFQNFVNGVTNCSPPPAYQHKFETSLLNVKNTKRLRKIAYANHEIFFDYLPWNTMNYGKLDKIRILYAQRLEKQVEFKYIGSRLFLEKVQFYEVKNSQNTLSSEYSLDYDDPLSLPPRQSKSKDILGYYNGRANNTLLPDLSLIGAGAAFNEPNLGDRRAFFEYTKKGTLKSITYPTKGKTYFEYESIPVKTKVFTDFNLVVGNNDLIANLLPAPIYDSARVYQFSSLVDSQVKLNLHLFSEVTDPVFNKGKILFQFIEQSSGQTVFSKEITLGKTVNQANFETVLNVDKTKNYLLKLKVVDYCNQCNASANFNYHSGYEKADGIGIRLKKQYDVDDKGDSINIKRLYYSRIEDINKIELLPDTLYFPGLFISSYYVQSVPTFVPVDESFGGCTQGENFFISQNILHSEPVVSIDSDLSYIIGILENPIITVSYGGDNFEKGGEQKEFLHKDESSIGTLREPIPDSPYFTAGLTYNPSTLITNFQNKTIRKMNYNQYNGLLNKSWMYARSTNGNLLLKSKVENTYSRSQTISNFNLFGSPIYNALHFPPGLSSGNELHNMLIVGYSNSTAFNRLESSVETEYQEDVPFDTEDDTAFKKYVVETHYEYNTPAKLTSMVKTVFPDNTTNQVAYQYAYEKGNQLMISRNMIGIPLETIESQTISGVSKIVERWETVYPTTLPSSQTGNLVVPLNRKSYDIINNSSSVDISYDKYDESGNILQYSKKDGLPVAVVWGYNKTYPIATIEGITYDQLTAAVSLSGIISASDEDAADPSKEGALLDALSNFRNTPSLSDKQITTYTYDPVIGLTSMTPPSGIRKTFVYDGSNRLKEINGRYQTGSGTYTTKKESEYKYNYKP